MRKISYIIFFFAWGQTGPAAAVPLDPFRWTLAGGFETNMNKFYQNPSLSSLDILLIAIDLEKPIKTNRTTTDNVNLNTDWITVHNIVKFIDQCSEQYKKAIRACLDISWMPAGQNVTLEDSKIRHDLYINVINPLESKLDHCFQSNSRQERIFLAI